ncbi:MAG: HAMP domain-containing histidine kinase [Nevskia sp.]|nr:HAMP domain-containing histidine kinase [Nevskia sp.]
MKKAASNRLYVRLLLWFCLANIVTLLISVAVTQDIVHRFYGLDPDWPELAQGANEAYQSGGVLGLEQWAERIREDRRIDISLYEESRPLLERPWPPPMQRLLPLLLSSESIVLHPAPEVALAGQRVRGADGVTRQMVALLPPHSPHVRLHILLGVQVALSLLAICGVGWLVARSISRPVAALQQAAQRMAAGDLTARVGGSFPQAQDELGLLAREFDNMAGRIEALIAHERSVLQDVSHELRSPLARLQLVLELAARDAGPAVTGHFERAEREIGRLDRLIEELLALSRMEADLPGRTRERVDLAALAGDCVDEAQIDARKNGVRLHLDVRQPAEVLGDAQLLTRALHNLLSNAIKFGAGAEVLVTVGCEDGVAAVKVRDHGPGVKSDELPRLFRPFFRGANSDGVSGHGLGLAIVDRVARAHGGSASAAHAPDGGLVVGFSLPAA